ncbi:MAG: Fe-Mn family superoxide dismutase [Blastocatellia bacterium]|nr:Fe-Mn family superoxide dismutase [Blastocatellia bacterium]MCS7158018.1 Fe-Mn family superoxide dismutase [Blastocatellia bacterium]MCX7752525.1 Fe-Mn family superoxide dismutase [Blastocatellia bacterium]MDW8167360.1 Fe-Mn family superoxide dismutase [Acidobacteriota bacterium]MDW8257315.1 Fe-Mn family superoxide dismutase [Acidobacteriota bacterium]
MAYQAKNFDHLLGTPGFSDRLLKNHFALYQGYVANTNKLAEALSALSKEGKTGTPEYAELKRRFGWEFNGMRWHEYYFGNMVKGGRALERDSTLWKKLVEDFGSYENWERDFKATGTMRGIGWVVLALDPMANRTFNTWINEHDVGHLAGTIPLLVMDVFEHAYMVDYDLRRADYIEAFFKAIDWTVVARRFDQAPRLT